ncbi:diguanylate cyclase [Uliginosibacterium sediminicola]|uniref:diguanylate cyclase n=1 Tax=Uliginosibacterium sediminicola TaxID=2024550 RepID=A0ABU9YYK6_9RHOO
MSIRMKMILALLFSSLMAINLVAFISHNLVARRLSDELASELSVEVESILTALRESLLLGSLIAALLSVALGLLLGARVSAKLRRLTQAIQNMQKGDFGKPLQLVSRDEVGALVSAFNEMSLEIAQKRDEIQRSHRKLEELAIRDGLTQLHNRRHFDEQLSALGKCPEHAASVSIMIGDIDHFKQVNDRFSHAVGDAVLREVGRILASNTRGSDLVARYGGEEFVIAFRDTDIAQARLICEKLRQRIAEFDWESIQPGLRITMSMGVARQLDEATLEHVVRQADVQLYRAKSQGRNQVCVALQAPPATQ